MFIVQKNLFSLALCEGGVITAFNHAKEEKKFKERKKKEEKVLRSLQVDQSLIDMLYEFDRDQFNCDRRFGENEDVTKDIFFICKPTYDKKNGE